MREAPRHAQLPQELVRRNKKWILLEHSANDDHRVGAHNVYHDASAKLGEIVRSYHRVFISGEKIVEPCLVFNEIINTRPIFQGPFHVSD